MSTLNTESRPIELKVITKQATSDLTEKLVQSTQEETLKDEESHYIKSLKYLESSWDTITTRQAALAFLSILPASFNVTLSCLVSAAKYTLGYVVCAIFGNTQLTIAYGVALSLDQMTFNMINNANDEAVGIRVGKFHGANETREARQCLTNSLVTMLFIDTVLVTALIFAGKEIFIAVGFDPDLARDCQSVMIKFVPSYLISHFNCGLSSYLISVETDVSILKYIPLGFIVVSALTLALAKMTSLGFWVVVIAMTAVQLVDLSVFMWMYLYRMDKV